VFPGTRRSGDRVMESETHRYKKSAKEYFVSPMLVRALCELLRTPRLTTANIIASFQPIYVGVSHTVRHRMCVSDGK